MREVMEMRGVAADMEMAEDEVVMGAKAGAQVAVQLEAVLVVRSVSMQDTMEEEAVLAAARWVKKPVVVRESVVMLAVAA